MVRRQVVVRGRVQGVGYRYSCARQASRHDVAGWVRNTADGAVEALLIGEPDAVEAVLEWMRGGPSYADVADVQVSEAPASTETQAHQEDPANSAFEIRD